MRRRYLFPALSLLLGACSDVTDPKAPAASIPAGPADPSAPGDRPPGTWLDHVRTPDLYLAQLKEMIRRHANLIYGPDCGRVSLPDAAFFPIEIGGGVAPELAVSFGYAGCGPAPNSFFRGTGGVMVQIWSGEGGRPQLLLEQAMHGFTPGDRRLVTVQHGGACGASGPDMCRVTYRWDEAGRRLETAERRTFSRLGERPEARYFGNLLMGTGPCDAREAALPPDRRRCGR